MVVLTSPFSLKLASDAVQGCGVAEATLKLVEDHFKERTQEALAGMCSLALELLPPPSDESDQLQLRDFLPYVNPEKVKLLHILELDTRMQSLDRGKQKLLGQILRPLVAIPGVGAGKAKRVLAVASWTFRESDAERLCAEFIPPDLDLWSFFLLYHGRKNAAELRSVLDGNGYELLCPEADRDISDRRFLALDALLVARAQRIGADITGNRLDAGIGQTLRSWCNMSGSTYLPASKETELARRVAVLLNVPEERISEKFVQGESAFWERRPLGFCTKARHRDEETLSARIVGIAASDSSEQDRYLRDFESRLAKGTFPWDESQVESIRSCLGAGFAILTGGPGTGKTTLIKALVETWDACGRRVHLLAPTGKAARVLAEAAGKKKGSTIHMFLGESLDLKGKLPVRSNDVLVVDEASMVDESLLARLLTVVPDDASLLLVGDADQIPAVSCGAPLQDLIRASAGQVCRLSTIHRQEKGGIPHAAGTILRGDLSHRFEKTGDFRLMGPVGNEEILDRLNAGDPKATENWDCKVVELVSRRLPRKLREFGLDPMADTQVLVPSRRKGLCVATLNRILQVAWNPAKPWDHCLPGYYETPSDSEGFVRLLEFLGYDKEERTEMNRDVWNWRPMDKVMNTRNDYRNGIFNGEQGTVKGIGRRKSVPHLIVEYPDIERTVWYSQKELLSPEICPLSPCYAMTIHKSQGSGYDCVIIPLSPSQPQGMLNRNLLYTAVTRAKVKCFLATPEGLLEKAVGRTAPKRLTGLGRTIEKRFLMETDVMER